MSVLATDDFNRASIGSNWTTISGESAWATSGSAVAAPPSTALDSSMFYNAVTWPNDQYSQFSIPSIGTAGSDQGAGPALRCASGARTYYRIVVSGTTGTNTWASKQVAGSYTNFASATKSGGWTTSDTAYAEIQGSSIKVRNGSGGSNIISTTDSSIASGSAGMSYSSTDASAQLDNFEGGDFAGGVTTKIKDMIGLDFVPRKR